MTAGTAPPPEISARRDPQRRRFLWRAVGSLAALGVLAAVLPLRTLVDALAGFPLRHWGLVSLTIAAGHLLAAHKWRHLLSGVGLPVTPSEALRAHFAGLFANFCLPSMIGGDVVRAGTLVARHGRMEAAAVAGLADRILDTGALLLLMALGAGLAPIGLPGGVRRLLVAGAAFLVVVVILTPWLAARIAAAPLPGRLAGLAARLASGVGALAAAPSRAFAVLVASLAVQGTFVLLNASLGAALGARPGLWAWLLAWPLSKLAGILPVSLGGLGVREAALATALKPFGVAAPTAVAVGLLWEAALLSVALLGGGAALWSRRRASGRSAP